jgi:excisionase family DNA binding protein
LAIGADVVHSGNQPLGDSNNPTVYDGVSKDTKPFAASLLHGTAASRALAGPLLDASEVARRLGVCRDTVYELCKRGELAHVRVLNAIRVHPDDLAAFCARRRS